MGVQCKQGDLGHPAVCFPHLLASSSSLSRLRTDTGVTRAAVARPCLTGTKFSFDVSHSASASPPADMLLM